MRYREKILTFKELESLLTDEEKDLFQAQSREAEAQLAQAISYADRLFIRSAAQKEQYINFDEIDSDDTADLLFARQLSDPLQANGVFGLRLPDHGRLRTPWQILYRTLRSPVPGDFRQVIASRVRSAWPGVRAIGVEGLAVPEGDVGRFLCSWYTAQLIGRRTMLLHAAAARFQLVTADDLLSLFDSIGSSLPEHVPDLYPLTRQLQRHFVIHVGGTNTGKTHDAMQALAAASSGVYLCPLRMLAYEGREVIRSYGTRCSFATGEEKDIDPEARHVSETIGMLDFSQRYEMAVIDECQLISGQDGSLYTNAILGVQAGTVHVCCAWSGLSITKQLIALCGDTCEVIEHHRTSELVFEETPFTGPRPHDAFIVFSRLAAYETAEWLERQGMRVSIVYGKLPYEVKMEAARRFESGDTDVLVATDAIAIGQNYNIERIVFRDITKHINRREVRLDSQTVKQVAGRAGRYGRFPIGYVNTFREADREEIREKLSQSDPESSIAPLELPEFLVEKDLPLSLIYKAWSSFECDAPFVKSDTASQLFICRLIESEFPTIDKKDEYNLASLPLDERDEKLIELLRSFLTIFCSGGNEDDYRRVLPSRDYLKRILRYRPHIADLELICRGLDLGSSFFYKMRMPELATYTIRLKGPVTERITQLLAPENEDEAGDEGTAKAGEKAGGTHGSRSGQKQAAGDSGKAPGSDNGKTADSNKAAGSDGVKATGGDNKKATAPAEGPIAYIYVGVSGECERNTARFPTGDWSLLHSRRLPQSYGNEASYIDYYCYKSRKLRPNYTRYDDYTLYKVRLDPKYIVSDEGDYYLAQKFRVIHSSYCRR